MEQVNYCGKGYTIGHGSNAICGEPFYKEIFTCDSCKIKHANSLITKQAEQIKMLRDDLLLSVPYLNFNSMEESKAEQALSATEQK